ncbi:MAG TPA: hypothetical protein VN840_07045 [Streptosporangiaceae bacterium]|nr:hypothetical protein [Streptosporangiaceae bacterium]
MTGRILALRSPGSPPGNATPAMPGWRAARQQAGQENAVTARAEVAKLLCPCAVLDPTEELHDVLAQPGE